jgi:8'-apo-carotenoid 13,14-cleaving dioxygenase
MTVTTANPYLEGPYAPVTEEMTAVDLPVEGTLPAELAGRYLRNGPNPLNANPSEHHWFIGDGMVHGIRLRDGRAEWYRNRYVGSERTGSLLGRPIEGVSFANGAGGPNTNVGGFAGKTWAMVEAGGTPVELSYELDSICVNGFGGTLQGPFTAHPKVDPATGEMHAMCYAPSQLFDHIQYVIVGTDGRVRSTTDIPMGMSMVHDMSLTETYAIAYDFPVTVNLDLAFAGSAFPFRWNPDYGSRIGLLPRAGTVADMVWIDAPICYSYHPMNAFDQADGTVVIDLCVYDRMFDQDIHGPFNDNRPRLERWVLNPALRTCSTTVVDASTQEFPRHHPKLTAQPYRYGYTVEVTERGYGATIKHDLQTGERSSFTYADGWGGGEPVFVPRDGATVEDDGWLMTFIHERDGQGAAFVVLDAQDVSRGPVATVTLPQRIPYGFHGNWVSDRSVAPS